MLIIDQASKSSIVGQSTFHFMSKTILGSRRKLSTTIGLCVHALADGVLLGSASSTKNTEVQMVVFLALVIHKVLVVVRTFQLNSRVLPLSHCRACCYWRTWNDSG